jgi:hypothetical protein
VRQRASNVPRHRASARGWWTHALARHQLYLALGAVAGAAALASGVMLILPGHAASPPAAGRCGLVTCTTWRRTPAAETPQPRISPRSISHAVARVRRAPAQPAVPARATPVPTPSSRQLAHHHGRGKGVGHRRHGHWASMGR